MNSFATAPKIPNVSSISVCLETFITSCQLMSVDAVFLPSLFLFSTTQYKCALLQMSYCPPHHLHNGTSEAVNLSLELNSAVQLLGFKCLNIKEGLFEI